MHAKTPAVLILGSVALTPVHGGPLVNINITSSEQTSRRVNAAGQSGTRVLSDQCGHEQDK